ncbi:MAG: hypothetical protein KC620_00830 [Myxococcales bacterium]|nr:hypothetical protein [Myxococcales bacterium]
MSRDRFLLGLALASGMALAACDEAEDTGCKAAPGNICTAVGTGIAGLSDDGMDPLATDLYLPQDVTTVGDGSFYILDWNNHRVRLMADNTIRTIIGTGYLGDAPNGLAVNSSLNHPTHVTIGPDEKLYIAAWHNSKVLRYDPRTETVEAICGTGARSFNGDGLPAVETFLDLPVATAFAPDGSLYIADQANQRIRALRPDGTVDTVVGIGEQGYSGDEGPAIEARLNLPVSQSAPPAGRIETSADGTLYIADTLNHVIRKVTPDGMISTIAGTGTAGNGSGDNPLAAALDTPSDVAVDANGNVFIADTMNNCIRKVSADGKLSTVAGVCGTPGFEGDGGPANAALLDRPYGVAVDTDGTVFVADTHNHVIRKVFP